MGRVVALGQEEHALQGRATAHERVTTKDVWERAALCVHERMGCLGLQLSDGSGTVGR